jgi:16S rRNA (guanine966-N2)-methyltransferase
VRETLFNWLMPRLHGARCLDLFAGTGVLGFEALSRGAASATFLERDPQVIRHLEDSREMLAAVHAEILGYDAVAWLAEREPVPYDIVFVDPPFAAGMSERILTLLSRGWLAADGVVYLEAPVAPTPDPAWTCHRQGQTRQVVFTLLAPTGATAQPNGEP